MLETTVGIPGIGQKRFRGWTDKILEYQELEGGPHDKLWPLDQAA
jgi:hypothetical protein